MKEHPILFKGSMVRAILRGEKTQTRRALFVPSRKALKGLNRVTVSPDQRDAMPSELIPDCGWTFSHWNKVAPGDQLWVKEAVRLVPGQEPDDGTGPVLSTYIADDAPTAADAWPWKLRGLPAMFCPRGLSRIQLKVTEVRIERLLSISAGDAIEEGLSAISKDGKLVKFGIPDRDGLPGNDDDGWPWGLWRESPVDAYVALWNKINGPLASAANPLVSVLTFERIPS